MNNKEESVQALRAYKERSGLSYHKLSHLIGVHSHTIYNWFRGHQEPSDMAEKLIKAFLEERED